MGCALIILQSSIIASGCDTYTVGETFPIMQQDLKQKEAALSIPTYTIEQPKPIVKKQTFWQKLKLIIKKLFR
jgi:hypothetical protein